MKKRICANCKHWGIERDYVCDRIYFSEEDEALSEAAKENSEFAGVHSYADDDSGLFVRVICGSKFGCVLFEENT